MSNTAIYQAMRAHPQFQELVRRRSRFAWTLAILVLVLFYGFVLVVAFHPSSLGQPIAAGSKITVGVVVELFMFILFWVLTAVYVRRANTEFDALNQQIIRDVTKGAR